MDSMHVLRQPNILISSATRLGNRPFSRLKQQRYFKSSGGAARKASLRCRADAGQRSLEQAVKVLNRIVGMASSPMARAKNEKDDQNTKPRKAKWIAVTGQASAKAPAEDGGLPDRRLSDYLALPVSEYSLLDPKWVEREAGNAFSVTIPMDDIMGLSIRPCIRVNVDTDDTTGNVTFSSETATLGDPILDREISLQLHATLAAVNSDDKPAFRQLSRRKPPSWSPPPEVRPMTTQELVLEQQDFLRRNSAALSSVKGSSVIESSRLPTSSSVSALSALSESRAGAAGKPEALSDSQTVAVLVETSTNMSESSTNMSDNWSNESSRNSSRVDDASTSGGNKDASFDGISSADTKRRDDAPEDPVRFTATLSSQGQTADSSAQSHSASADSTASASSPASSSMEFASAQSDSPDDDRAGVQQLAARVDLRVNFNVPLALRIIPGPLLSYAGGLVFKVALQQLLPSFLDLLAQDFQVWSAGTQRSKPNHRSSRSSLLAARTRLRPTDVAEGNLSHGDERGNTSSERWADDSTAVSNNEGIIDPLVKMPDGWQTVGSNGVSRSTVAE